MKMKFVIQSAINVEYTSVIVHMVYVSDSPEERMNNLGKNVLAEFGEFCNVKKPNDNFTGLARQVC